MDLVSIIKDGRNLKRIPLLKQLKELVDDMEGEGKFIGLVQGQKPYVQVDEPSPGVAIMNISYLTEAFQHDLFKEANKRFRTLMSELDADSEGYVLSKNI
jgi:hypothetical protein